MLTSAARHLIRSL